MIMYDCDTIRDLLPSFVRGEVLPHERSLAQQHFDVCADCAREATIVRLLHEALDPMPAGLEARVLTAVSVTPRARRFTPARLAMAATVAAAVFGGALVMNRAADPGPASEPLLTAEFDLPAAALLGWVTDDDPLLHGGASLDELTVEELEVLLAELDS